MSLSLQPLTLSSLSSLSPFHPPPLLFATFLPFPTSLHFPPSLPPFPFLPSYLCPSLSPSPPFTWCPCIVLFVGSNCCSLFLFFPLPPLLLSVRVPANEEPLSFCSYIYSGTSDNGHSKKWTTSVEWTNYLPPTNCSMHFYLRDRDNL